jgi:hypothetical protein
MEPHEMNLFKSSIISILLALMMALSIATQALASDECPLVSEILLQDAAGISEIRCDDNNECAYRQHAPIDKAYYWIFFLDFTKNPGEDAKITVQRELQTLVFKSGPTHDTEGYLKCRYTTASGFEGTVLNWSWSG